MKVTFVGVGAIGLPMALQIQKAGHEVTGIDVSEAVIANAKANGIETVRQLADAPPAEVVVVMVATPDQLAGFVARATDLVRGQLWLIMSTVGPQSVREQGEVLQRAGARARGCPGDRWRRTREDRGSWSSSTCRGAVDDVTAATPILEAMGTVRVTGQRLGDGQSIKVVNQHLCSVHIVAAAEALSLARSLGLDPAAVLRLIERGGRIVDAVRPGASHGCRQRRRG